MNINDYSSDKIPDNPLKAIFEKQRELALKYSEIEKMGTLLQETHKNVQTAFGQKFIKDFAWRVTEEIAEALEAKKTYDYTKENKEILLHYQEEMIDALHFLTELTIIAGYDEIIFEGDVLPIIRDETEWEIVYYLGLMCNCLKNKPWKQTEMLTDENKFKFYLRQVWLYYLAIMYKQGLEISDIYNLYFKKNQVNNFRIRSKY